MMSEKWKIEAPMGTSYYTIGTDGKVKRVPFKSHDQIDWKAFEKVLEKINNENKKR